MAHVRAPIAMLTDFGYRDHYVGAMKGVIASLAPTASIIDITHGIPPQQVIAGAIALRECLRFFPPGTVFVAVVDPGVGSERLPIAIETATGMHLVGPDNGLLWPAAASAQIKAVVEIRAARYRLGEVSASFHGRDIFAPAAAWLWRGVRLGALGPPLKNMIQLSPGAEVVETAGELAGEVIYIDGFGNLVTNLSRPLVEGFAGRATGCRLSIRLKRRGPIELRRTYADVRPGVAVALFGSFDLLEVAIRDGSAAAHFAAKCGEPVLIRAERRPSARS